MNLRPYQQEAVDAVYEHLRTKDTNPCVVLPTGTGKSLVLAKIASDAVTLWGGRVLILAHVKELLEQNADKVRKLCPELMRSMAMQRGDLIKLKQGLSNGIGGSQEEASPTIINPYLTVFGTAIPQFFYESLSLRMLGNGLVARCLILDAGRRGKPNRSKFITLTDSLKRSIEVVRGYHGKEGNLTPVNPTMMVLGATDEANALLDAINLEYCATYDRYQGMRAQIPMAFWARAFEKVLKLSMLYAISSNVLSPVIGTDAVEWARKFTDFLTEQMLYLAQSYSYENPFDEKCRKILRFLETSGGTGSHSALLKRSHESKETFDSIMSTLEETGAVSHEFVETGGRMKKVYRRNDSAGP